MFKLHFKPNFAFQRLALLKETEAPPTPLPPYLEDAINQISNFNPQEKSSLKPNLWLLCFQASKPILLKSILTSTVTSLFASGSTLIAVQILKNTSTLSTLLIFSFLYFAFNALAQVGSFFNNRQRALFGLNIETVLVGLISKKILKLSANSADAQSSGNLKVLMFSDVANISQFFNNVARNFIPAITALAVMSPLLVRFSGVSGIAGILILSLIIPISLALNHISAKVQARSQEQMDKLVTLIEEWITNIRLVRFLSWEEFLQTRISARLKDFMSLAAIQHFLACLIFGLSTTWWMITAVGILVFSNWFHYSISLTSFFGSVWLLTFIAGYFTHLPNTIRLFGLALPSIQRIEKFLRHSEQHELLNQEWSTVASVTHLNPIAVIFQDVTLSYTDAVLKQINLRLELSQKTAILGEVSSGKTSLLRLLSGEIPPSSGKILIEFENGLQRSLWDADVYYYFRSLIGVVPQSSYISSDLLSSNISLSDPESDSSVLHAVQLAELSADLEQFPQGLSQSIGEAGVNLSGGQKQRLALARAFFSKRDFLVLDDTLSAVDSQTETKLMTNLVTRKHGFVLVTHRLKEIMSLDQVIVLKSGEVAEVGTPKDLASQPESFFNRALLAYEDAHE